MVILIRGWSLLPVTTADPQSEDIFNSKCNSILDVEMGIMELAILMSGWSVVCTSIDHSRASVRIPQMSGTSSLHCSS